MNVSYLKSFEKKYSFDFEVSENSHDLLLCFKSIVPFEESNGVEGHALTWVLNGSDIKRF